ncbi:Poly(ADP-ribose) glycohydrolase [Anabarilius grahami]|uniref:poly(ADP-ribose) glycohydrolase n=1 Tax=Anabarilius grahami TaxID=495550 RepID=A0A3N0XP93_ANAGA|nr:Poly(ADP-ribose) glycohydrolase [Anabarilius grahami]
MSDCEKRRKLQESESLHPERSEDAETQSKGSSKPQRKRPVPGRSSQNSLDLWLQKKSSVTRTSPARTDLSISSEERPSTERETEPRRTGSVLVSGDPDANTETRKITHFFTKTPVRVARSRPAAVADGKALSRDVTRLDVPVTDLRRAPVCSGPLPALKPTDGHTVMIRTDLLDPGKVPVPYPSPEKRSDCWDDWHTIQSRWDLIHQALSVPLKSSHDVKDAILKYNAGQAKAWNFSALHSYCKGLQESEAEQMFGELLPAMAQLALRAPSLFTQPIPLLRTQRCCSITLSQEQVSSLLANAFFCTFPRRNSRRTDFSNYPDINFNRLFEGPSPKKLEKLKTLLCYFERITRRRPTGLITYTRQCLQRLPSWASSEKQFSKLRISCDGTIEEQGYGMLQVDFANRFVGGGVTGSGLVQEEIRFLINPELIAARLFTEVLEDNECLIITDNELICGEARGSAFYGGSMAGRTRCCCQDSLIGFAESQWPRQMMLGTEQFSRYSGYSDTYRWDGNHDDQTPRDEWQRRVTEIVAIDALHYRNFLQQFHPENMTRELNKAYCGFTRPGVQMENLSAVATGNWGCGAFGGDTRLKAVLQMMAAAEAERDVMYFTFGDAELVTDVHSIHTLITRNRASVGSVFNMLLQYYERVIKETSRAKPQKTLYSFLSEHL